MNSKISGFAEEYKKALNDVTEALDKMYYLGYAIDDLIYHCNNSEIRDSEMKIYKDIDNKLLEVYTLLKEAIGKLD